MVFFKAEKLQRLAEVLQRVQKAIEEEGGDLTRVENDLEETADVAGLDLEVARMADGPTLERVLTAGGGGSASRCWLAAELLFLDGLLAAGRGQAEAGRHRLEKARRLYRALGSLGADLDLPDRATEPDERLRRLEELLG